MKRGDIAPAVAGGAYGGKPRPVLIIQTDYFADHPSVTILPITSHLVDAPLFRYRLQPDAANGLAQISDVMVDKLQTVPRPKIASPFGHLSRQHMTAIEQLLLLWIGIA